MLRTLLRSTRMSWGAKNIHMYLLALTYASAADPFRFLAGLLLVTLLWGALYSLNDLTDIDNDRKDRMKRKRPFIENHVDPRKVLLFVGLLLLVSLAGACLLDRVFCLILLLMVLNQFLYTLPPVRLKDTVIAPLASTATNTVLRLASAAVLLGGLLVVPVPVYVLMYLAGMGTYLMYKEMRGLTTLVSTAFCILLAFSYLSGYISILQILLVIVPPFLATVPLYLSNFRDRERMVEVADVIYHRVLVTIYIICILVLLFLR
ncbi:UbiA family prenyltransferase [Methanothermobacter thermautotrophicus]|uniref:UbiA family prenyltransferase n=1 Tax=Methanothermobacter thermautotrophicus TaxID=145262 RepID=UPI0022B942ED|nr:UbiA family prenyltransferase [Methanothermobacter thermautotrophicus]MDI6818510.1 UbiA family prenyltransferase [Methanothermobacter thermautotrophicus]WBF08384.1 UbiA family prenyltransferase [Methanothermobacter thermautotrophicus]